METTDMDKETSIKLIKLYEKYRVLWDPKNKSYYDKHRKQEAWEDISAELEIPVDSLKKKMSCLTGSYRREKSRYKKSLTASGPGRHKIYTSKWFAYKHFNFLSEKTVTPRKTLVTFKAEPVDVLQTNGDDTYDNFGKHVASELRKYDPTTLAYVKKSIADIIFEADLGRIREYSELRSTESLHQIFHTSSSPPSPSPSAHSPTSTPFEVHYVPDTNTYPE